ncbi:class III lanthipeptide [Bacillus toyonensis]|nr:class III lanthipeptide [Bacillus toyonensis]
MSRKTVQNSVLSLQRMKAANANDTGKASNVSILCKKNSSASVFMCVFNG